MRRVLTNALIPSSDAVVCHLLAGEVNGDVEEVLGQERPNVVVSMPMRVR